MAPVRRSRVIALLALVVVVFLVISALLARAFSADGAERSAITNLVQAEARGDQNGVLDQIDGCRGDPACRARVADDVAALRRPGTVSIIQIQPSAGFSLGSTLGTARVAWNAGSSLPIVQCLKVRRAGNVLRGLRVELLEVSKRIPSDQACPAHY